MIRIIFIIIFFISLIANTQSIEKQSVKTKYSISKFYVLKSDKEIKHGSYIEIDRKSNQKLLEGRYEYNKKDSIWNFYTDNGILLQKYDFNTQKLLFDVRDNFLVLKNLRVLHPDGTISHTIHQKPIFLGGKNAYNRHINQNLVYPKEALKKEISARIDVVFTINENGSTTNHHTLNSTGYGLDEEAIRLIKTLPNYWIPARVNGKPATTEGFCSVHFTLKK